MSRQIKSGNVYVRCESDQVVMKGAVVNEVGTPITVDPNAPEITVSETVPADPDVHDLWVDIS